MIVIFVEIKGKINVIIEDLTIENNVENCSRCELIVGEVGISCGSSFLTRPPAAKELREAEDNIIRRGDKASAFVILDKEDYISKMDNMLEDTSKFLPINHDNTEQLKKKLCSVVEQIKGSVKFPKPIGDHKPGYAYGTVKTHKPETPLRPIISQISSLTYQIAKSLNRLLTPYVPNSFSLSSATDFIDNLKSQESFNHIASMDVTSLFTHVSIQETIDIIIIQKVYHSQRASLDIPENTLRQLLLAFTKEVPFYSHRGELFQQIDGVAMGSPLGVLFAHFYMGAVEERVFEGTKRPKVYTRYIDDCFLSFDSPCSSSPEVHRKLRLAIYYGIKHRWKTPFL
ncbi:uncharacterized protein LOC143028606 [Oratosquilla oratoria]|uniref:uncharacterized protein LOC143028606 n=1 Tax=Oratosquilla oratoria TaxID=337810 RepID=UPI003F7664E5